MKQSKYASEIQRLVIEKNLSASDMQKITHLVSVMSEGEGDEAHDETMYAYLSGEYDWRKDYREFIA